MTFRPQESPSRLGYRMPAEWEPHEATWLAWPRNRDTWPTKFSRMAEVWRRLVEILAPHEHVYVLAGQAAARDEAYALVGRLAGVTVLDVTTDDAWIRDHGPTFLVRDEAEENGAYPALAAIDWTYNAWGNKYPPYDHDAVVARRVAQYLGVPRFATDVVLEGGAIETNGRGTVLTSEECLLNPNRNPHLCRADLEPLLCEFLGARQVLWLGRGIAGDDTDGHIDELARFVAPRTIVTVVEEDPEDANYAALRDNLERLRGFSDLNGAPFEIVTLPMPRPVYVDGVRLPACYANFYIANGVVIVPAFGDPADHRARDTLAALFPDREVVGFDAVDLIEGLGGVHCITQQQPATGGRRRKDAG